MTDLYMIRHLMVAETYFKFRQYLSNLQGSGLMAMLAAIDEWFTTHTEDLDVDDLYFLCQNKVDPEQLVITIETLKNLELKESALIALNSHKRQKILEEISTEAYNVSMQKTNSNRLDYLYAQLNQNIQETDFLNDDLTEIIESTATKRGLRWRLETLNQMLGSLRPGDFGFIVARPETGKTTFLSDQATHFASQLEDSDGPILWINNEEQGQKVKLRWHESALALPLSELKKSPARWADEFNRLTQNKMLMYSPGETNKYDIQRLCDRHKPRAIIVDQLDKITGFKGDREDLRLGAIYQWFRDLAKTYEGSVIGATQADVSAEGELWLNMSHVSGSKTSKQAEADWILGIGKKQDPAYSQIRGLSIMKNKLLGDEDTNPALRHGKREVIIEEQIGRYKDI